YYFHCIAIKIILKEKNANHVFFINRWTELFQRDRSVTGKYICNIFKEGELVKNSVWAKFAYTTNDGKDQLIIISMRW
ncbi:MAG: hypothetical protein RR313_12220, partial [Anaerovoracaceae bacterium]